jgi:transcriptional regulator with XRE-family HTH domain
MSFAEILKALRGRCGLDQNAAAKVLRLNGGTVIDMERNRFEISRADFERWSSQYENYAIEMGLQPREEVSVAA